MIKRSSSFQQATMVRRRRARSLFFILVVSTAVYLFLAANYASRKTLSFSSPSVKRRRSLRQFSLSLRKKKIPESPYIIPLVPMHEWRQVLDEMEDSQSVFEEFDQILDASQGIKWGIARQHHFLIELGRLPGFGLNLSMREFHQFSRDRAILHSKNYYQHKKKALERCQTVDPAQRKKIKWFATSNRHDFTAFVAEELQELGLCNSSAPIKTGLDFYIGEQFETALAPPKEWAFHYSPFFRNDSNIGALPGAFDYFGTKLSFSTLFEACDKYALTKNKLGNLCDDALLFTFNVDAPDVSPSHRGTVAFLAPDQVRDIDRVYHSLLRMSTPIWFIVKPQTDTFLSRGMHLSRLSSQYLASKQAFLQWLGASVTAPRCTEPKGYVPALCDRRKMSFQRYVHTPALFGGRKFDVRIWILITSLNPLRIFIMRHAYPKIAAMPFSTDPDFLQFQCMHIKMLMPDDSCPVSEEEYLHVFSKNGYPKSTASPVFFDSLRFPGLSLFAHQTDGLTDAASKSEQRRLATLAEHVWSAKTWPGIETSLTKTMLLVRTGLMLRDEEIYKDILQVYQNQSDNNLPPIPPNYNRWILLSPDVVIDDQGRPSIIEINTNGHIMGTHKDDGGFMNLFHDDGYLRAMLQILGADSYPRRRLYDQALTKAIDQFCTPRTCTTEAKKAMAKAVDEEAHAGPHWYRLYPPSTCREPDTTAKACIQDELGSWWPHQARFTQAQLSAFDHTPLDTLVADFLQTVDTAKIHGIPQVPGSGRWQPRERFYEESHDDVLRSTTKKKSSSFKKKQEKKRKETQMEQDTNKIARSSLSSADKKVKDDTKKTKKTQRSLKERRRQKYLDKRKEDSSREFK